MTSISVFSQSKKELTDQKEANECKHNILNIFLTKGKDNL